MADEDTGTLPPVTDGTGGDTKEAAGTQTPPPAPPVTGEHGFPENTPIAEMKPGEVTAYWKFQSRQNENRWKSVAGDQTLEKVKADLAELAELRKAQQTPQEQAINAAKEQGRAEALLESNTATAQALLRMGLGAAGRDEAAVGGIISATNPASFLSNGKVDEAKIAAFISALGPVTGRRNNSWADTGQGSRQQPAKGGMDRGAELYERTHPNRSK